MSYQTKRKKNGPFGFALGLACAVGAKPNPAKSGQVVPFARWAKIEFKKSTVGKNKKQRVGQRVELIVVRL